MGFGLDDIALAGPTFGLYNAYKGLTGQYGSGGGGYGGALPFDYGAGNTVDVSRINSIARQVLGRDASRDEIDHFSPFIKNGDISYEELSQVMQGLPEFGEKKLAQYGGQYEQHLGASDNAILNKAAGAGQSMAARLGREGSSVTGAHIASAGANLAIQRQSALANFYGNGYQGLLGAYRDRGDAAQNRAYGLNDSRTAYNRGLMGYQTQRNDYMDLYKQQSADNLRNAIIGGLFSAGGQLAGGMAGRPAMPKPTTGLGG